MMSKFDLPSEAAVASFDVPSRLCIVSHLRMQSVFFVFIDALCAHRIRSPLN